MPNSNDRVPAEIFLEGVRSFSKPVSAPISPLTVLVGENSAGKSTFIAMLAAILQPGFPFSPDFTDEPYDLGGFSDIASIGAAAFTIGIRQPSGTPPVSVAPTATQSAARAPWNEIRAVYKAGAYDVPVLAALSIRCEKVTIHIDQKDDHYHGEAAFPSGDVFKSDAAGFLTGAPLSGVLLAMFGEAIKSSIEFFEPLMSVNESFPLLSYTSHSFAPVRTKPRRVYDGLFPGGFKSDGSHVPSQLAVGSTQKLEAFGKLSGLFQGLMFTKMHGRPGAPFQLLVESDGVNVPITAVGYGVSQSLPFIADALSMPSNGFLALQQPEVHLHPKAQAAVGTLLTQIVATTRGWVAVETHSDALLNRIRIEVAQDTIPAENVKILFFDKKGATTSLHVLSIDSGGNILNAPSTYREFFLEEEMRLLTRGD